MTDQGTASTGAERRALDPLFDNVVVKELEPDTLRRSGLALPPGASSHQPPHHGIVVAAGPGLDWWESANVKMPVEPGDHIVFPWQAGVYIELDEEKLLVLRVGQILGIVK
jgi:chaperonin GroES